MYSKLANYYDELGWSKNASLELDLINNVLIENNVVPETLCDLGCGTGELLSLLNESYDDLEMIGIDLSDDMISVAKKKLKDNKKAKLVTGDMRSFKLAKRVDAITCMYDTINHLLKKEYWRDSFKCIYDSLKYGGVFVMDFVPLGSLKNWEGVFVREEGTSTLIREINFDKKTNILTTDVNAFVKANYFGTYRNIRESVKETSYNIKEVIALLKEAGFKNISVYNEDFKRYRFNFKKANKEQRLYISAKK